MAIITVQHTDEVRIEIPGVGAKCVSAEKILSTFFPRVGEDPSVVECPLSKIDILVLCQALSYFMGIFDEDHWELRRKLGQVDTADAAYGKCWFYHRDGVVTDS